MTGEELDGNGDCVHKAVDSVEPGYTGKADQGSRDHPCKESYNISQDKRVKNQIKY